MTLRFLPLGLALPVLVLAQTPELPKILPQSLSVGDSDRGELLGGVELPEDAIGVRRLTVVRERQSGFGTRHLVELLLRVGRALSELPEHAHVPMRVGNLSLKQGGEMRWSHSHRAGRDADLLPYLLGEENQPLLPDAFVVLDDEGKGRWKNQPVHLDVPRMWRLVRELIADGHAEVQVLYFAEPLTRLLLTEARTKGEPEWLVQRARSLLSEPAHAGRHDDHLHLRLRCSRADRLAGCQDDAAHPPWLAATDAELRLQITEMLGDLGAVLPADRVLAVQKLTWFQPSDPRVPEALVWLAAWDAQSEVRQAAQKALEKSGIPQEVPLLWQLAEIQPRADDRAELLRLAILLATPIHAPLLLGILDPHCGNLGENLQQNQCHALQLQVVTAIRPWLLETAADPLIHLLRVDDPTLARAALHTLECLANRGFMDADAAERWWHKHAGLGRHHWLLSGMQARGLPVHAPLHVLAPQLIALLDGADPVAAQNAEALLETLMTRDPREQLATNARKYRSWLRFWQTHERMYRVTEPEATGLDLLP